MAACLAAWAARGEAHRRRVRNGQALNAGRNRRIWTLYHDDGLTAKEIGRLFDLTAGAIYAVLGHNAEPTPSRVGGHPPADYERLRARVLALRDGERMSETEIMTALAMPRVLVAAILRETQP